MDGTEHLMTNKVEIKKPDFNKWKNAVDDLRIKAGFKVEEIAKETAPVKTGKYISQISFDGSNTVTANAKYSADIEYGTGVHEITPKTAQALHFKVDGKNVFAKRVFHPGTKPKPVMRTAASETQKQIPSLWQQVQRENGIN